MHKKNTFSFVVLVNRETGESIPYVYERDTKLVHFEAVAKVLEFPKHNTSVTFIGRDEFIARIDAGRQFGAIVSGVAMLNVLGEETTAKEAYEHFEKNYQEQIESLLRKEVIEKLFEKLFG